MDIENMHPFCLPFSLCHDATSSIMTNDIIDNSSTQMHNTDKERNNARYKTLSPSDDLYTQSLLDDSDDLTNHRDNETATEYYSLHLDIDIERTDITSDHRDSDLLMDDFGFHEKDCCDDDSLYLYKNHHHHHHEDWCSSHYSLFSPNNNIQHVTKRRKSIIRTTLLSSAVAASPTSSASTTATTNASATSTSTATTNNHHNQGHNNDNNHHHHHHHHLHHHQVFQHAVDPMDMIKSSPTLAQLNLNSNDDPSDSLWDNSTIATLAPPTNNSTSILTSATSTALASSTSAVVATTFSSSTDLSTLSNCASLTGSSNTCPTHTNHLACNHYIHHSHLLNSHHHHHHNQTQPLSSPHITNQSNLLANPTSPFAVNLNTNKNHLHQTCTHVHHNHNHTLHQNLPQPNNTCQALARANDDINDRNANNNLHNPSPCCQNQALTSQMSIAINQQHSSCHQNMTNLLLNKQSVAQSQTNGEKQQMSTQQRSSSPALVTSSSSPLSSSTLATLNTLENNRHIPDNKLKENIDYLTALLCNGKGKLEQNSLLNSNVQQSTISSTMVKSYATLAQSLSTGPKLLERPYQHHPSQLTQRDANLHQNQNHFQNHHQHHQQHHQQQQQQQQQHNHHHHHQQQQQPPPVFNNNYNRQGDAMMGPGPTGHWFKPAIESSVSAADSTAETQQMASNNNNNNNNNSLCSPYVTNHQQLVNTIDNNNLVHQPNPKTSELKVLSSLLNSRSPAGVMAPVQNCPNWRTDCNQQEQLLNNPTIASQAQQNMLINQYQPSQQQQQQQQQPPPPPTEPNNKPEPASIPANGRPITLTPLVTNNGLIVQQKQSKPPLFVQPASPSASSTASSGGNGNNQLLKQTTSERSGRPNSMSTDGSLSSHDEGFSSQVDNDDSGSTRADSDDDDDDVDSDDESFYGDYTNNDLIGASISDNPECKWTLNMGRTRRNGQRRFFWQYNVQSKGPKGARICSTDGSDDPFVLPEASDPVFSNDCQIEGVKHSGKARRGDGNDLTPNPRKLLMIGLELKKLGKIINDLVPVTDLPLNARNKTRKEKNKLASRACRLKKKAQHEANKIKLYGLQREHQQAVLAIYDTRKYLREKLLDNNGELIVASSSSSSRRGPNLGSNVTTIAERCSMRVAGQTSDYVNSVLEQVVSGCIDGGLST